MKGKNNKIRPPPLPLPSVPHCPIPSGSQTAAVVCSSVHSFVFQTTASLYLLFCFIYSGEIVALVMFSLPFSLLTLLSSSWHPSSLLLSLFPLSSHPLRRDSWPVRGVTGMSRLSPSLSQLVDLCLRDYSARRSLLASLD